MPDGDPSKLEISLQSRLATCLTERHPGYQLDTFAPFYAFLPDRIGKSVALDAALECVVQAHQRLTGFKPQQCIGTTQVNHLQVAISALQKDVSSLNGTPPSADVVATALLLATCEIYDTSHNAFTWTSHVGGINDMIAQWDPDHLSDYQLALVDAYTSISICECLISREPCFLAQDDWNRMLRQSTIAGSDATRNLDAILAHLPGLVSELSRRRDGRQDRSKADSLMRKLSDQLHEISPPSPCDLIQFAGRIGDSYRFSSPRQSRDFVVYWTAVLILHGVGDQTALADDKGELSSAIDHVCNSVDYAKELSPLGSVYMAWCLPVVYASVKETNMSLREWILQSHNSLFAVLGVKYSTLSMKAVGESLTGGLVGDPHLCDCSSTNASQSPETRAQLEPDGLQGPMWLVQKELRC
jgi:hypothetical protein